MGARVDAGVGVAFVRTQYSLLLLLFFGLNSNLLFHMHFYQCFFMLPLAAPCRTESKWRFCVDTMLVSLKK